MDPELFSNFAYRKAKRTIKNNYPTIKGEQVILFSKGGWFDYCNVPSQQRALQMLRKRFPGLDIRCDSYSEPNAHFDTRKNVAYLIVKQSSD